MTGLFKFDRADQLTPRGCISAADINFRNCADEHRYRGVHRSVFHLHFVSYPWIGFVILPLFIVVRNKLVLLAEAGSQRLKSLDPAQKHAGMTVVG